MKIVQFILAVVQFCLTVALFVAQTILTNFSLVAIVAFGLMVVIMGALLKLSWNELKSEEV